MCDVDVCFKKGSPNPEGLGLVGFKQQLGSWLQHGAV